MHLVRYHERGIEAQAEVADDLVIVGLVLILLQESGRAGEGDLVDIFLHLFGGHAKSGVDEFQGFLFRVHDHADAVLVAFRIGVLADEGQLFQLGDGVAAVGHQLTEENVVIGIQPFFNNRKNIFAVDGKTSMLICHCNSLLHRKGCLYRSVSAARFCSVSHCNSLCIKSQ